MSKLLKKRKFTILEYHKMIEIGILRRQDKLELIKGKLLHLTPTGIQHQKVVNNITALFVPLFFKKAIVNIQAQIQINRSTILEPDILLLKPNTDYYSKNSNPLKSTLLLIEVADQSLEVDRTIKLPLYAKAGIIEYWIVNLIEDQIEVYQSPTKDGYKKVTIVKKQGQIACERFPTIKFAVKDIVE